MLIKRKATKVALFLKKDLVRTMERMRHGIGHTKLFLRWLINRIKNVVKKIWRTLVKAKDYIVFYYFRSKLTMKSYCAFAYRKTLGYSLQIGTLLYLAFLWALLRLLSGPLATNFLADSAVTFFTSIGAMLGGVLAIVFSVSTLLMQNASQSTSAGFYDLFAKDKVTKSIFYIITFFVITFFGLGLLATSQNWIQILEEFIPDPPIFLARFSIAAIGFVLWLLNYLIFNQAFDRIDPNKQLDVIEKFVHKEIENIDKIAKGYAKLVLKNPKLKGQTSVNGALALVYQRLAPHFNKINMYFDHLFDYHDKLLSNSEKKTARLVLKKVTNLLIYYLELRKDSSIATLDGEFLFATRSDSYSFLTQNLEQLLAKGETYMKQNEVAGITEIINSFKDLARAAGNIKYVASPAIGGQNAILTQVQGIYNQFMESAMKINNLEAVFQGTRAYKSIGRVLIENNADADLGGLITNISKAGQHGIIYKQSIVLGEATDVYITILGNLTATRYHSYHIFCRQLLNHLEALIIFAIKSQQLGHLANDYSTNEKLITAFSSIENMLADIAQKIEDSEEADEQKEWIGIFLTLAKELRNTLRGLSEKIEGTSYALIQTFADMISNICINLMLLSDNPKWEGNQVMLLDQVKWYIHQPSWFVNKEEKIDTDLNFDSLIEAVSKIGLKALNLGKKEIAIEAIKILSKFASDVSKKEKTGGYGFTEPRIMERACYIGVLALKNGDNDVLAILKEEVAKYQTEYEAKRFSHPDADRITSPRRDQLEIEMRMLATDFYQKRDRFMPQAENILVNQIEPEDLDNFIDELWPSAPSQSKEESEEDNE